MRTFRRSRGTAAAPSWERQIRAYFRREEVSLMRGQGIDLADYATVKRYGALIYEHLSTSSRPLGGQAWPAECVATFRAWMETGYPLRSRR